MFLWSDITKALKKIVHKYHIYGSVELGKPSLESSTHRPSTSSSQSSSSESEQPVVGWSQQSNHIITTNRKYSFIPLQQRYFQPHDGGEGLVLLPRNHIAHDIGSGSDQYAFKDCNSDIPRDINM